MENKKEALSEWYVEALQGAKMFDYAPVHGCIVFRERAYAAWEHIQKEMDTRIKEMGVPNVYFPMFIPESLLKKEAEHFKGFVPEVAWVEKGEGDEERYALRPTSETIIYTMFSKWIRSHRDLPLKINQWCNIVRWEIKQTKPFLRTREFLWQEGHTAHATREDAEKMVFQALDAYADLAENVLAIPVISGTKTKKETFAGAVYTTTIEALMPDGKALQMGTSHYLGTHFPQVFGVKFMGIDEKESFCHTTSWGVSTRLIGAIAMVHGDDKGLIFPPAVAPEHVVIVPIYNDKTKQAVAKKAGEIAKELKAFRVHIDADELHTPGWKFAEYELQGIPVRLEVGPKDMEKKQVVLVRRDTGEKVVVKEGEIAKKAGDLLKKIQASLLEKATKDMRARTTKAKSLDEIKDAISQKNWVKMMWCGSEACEEKLKDDTDGGTIRCIPRAKEEQEKISDKCAACGGKAVHVVYFAKSY